MSGGIILPAFDPVAISIGPFAIRWYALSYLAGFLLGYWLLRIEARRPDSVWKPEGVDSLLNHIVIGGILGGRLGFAFFYHPDYYFSNPLEILKVWQGGMSFHGGLAGGCIAMWLCARRQGIHFLSVTDRAAMVLPIGLFFGRIANFINGELFGRKTDLPWGMVFPRSFGEARHPSQLYEAGLEGLLLGIVMFVGYRRGWLATTGHISAVFLAGYGISRFLVEFVRQPDPQLGFVFAGLTMGQLLSLPMIIAGIWLYRTDWTRGPGKA